MTFHKGLTRNLAKFLLFVFVVTSLSASTNSASSHASQTQAEMNRDACDKYKKSDAKLNGVYRQILNDYREDKIFIEKLKAAQRAWLAFRDAHLASIYPAADARLQYGSVNPMCQCLTLERLTQERAMMLQQWIDGTIEGDVCAGSIKFKK